MMSTNASTSAVVKQMLEFAAEAAKLALTLRAEGLQVTHKGDDLGQALTQADLAISRMLHQRFGPRVIEEETAEAVGRAEGARMLADSHWTFVADPIDGTKPYAGGLSGWGTMIAACRNGWPVASVMTLPAWFDDRIIPILKGSAQKQRGILLAGFGGQAFWAPTVAGRQQGKLEPLQPPSRRTHHVGWLPVAAQRYTLDYTKGFFPWCEGGAIADAALVAMGRLEATLTNHKLWDLAPILPVLEPLGFRLFHWRDLMPPPDALIDLFDDEFSGHDDLWLLCRNRDQAERLSAAISVASHIRA